MDVVLLANEVREAIETLPDMPDEALDAVHAALVPLLCKHAGHLPGMDHCGKPEHDYCHRCGDETPGKAPRV